MGILKSKPFYTIFDGRNLVKNITPELSDCSVIYIQDDEIIVYKQQNAKDRVFTDGQIVYIQGKGDKLYSVDEEERENMHFRLTVSGKKKNISSYIFYSWKVFDGNVFLNMIGEENGTSENVKEYIEDILSKSAEKCLDEDKYKFIRNLAEKTNEYINKLGIQITKIDLTELVITDADDVVQEKPKAKAAATPAVKMSDGPAEIDDIMMPPVPQTKPKCKFCGFEPEGRIPKFCPECGSKFS